MNRDVRYVFRFCRNTSNQQLDCAESCSEFQTDGPAMEKAIHGKTIPQIYCADHCFELITSQSASGLVNISFSFITARHRRVTSVCNVMRSSCNKVWPLRH